MLPKLNYKILLVLWIFCISSAAQGKDIPWRKLQSGDILLFSLQCRVCQLVELETGFPYSHMAMVLKQDNTVQLVEAWADGVKIKTIEEFLSDKKFTKDSSIKILRHKSQKVLPTWQGRRIDLTNEPIQYLDGFLGKKFDPAFLWYNVDEERQQKYYCSEFIFKFYSLWLKNKFQMKPKPMTYTKYYADWKKYFRGPVPQGLPGISPAHFLQAPEFITIDF